jgi:transcriptional regulator with XRE-family HTH domain
MYNQQEMVLRIKETAKERKIPINTLLDECNLNIKYISDLQKGNDATISDVYKIAEYLNVSVDYLLGCNEKSKHSTDNNNNVLSILSKGLYISIKQTCLILSNCTVYNKKCSAITSFNNYLVNIFEYLMDCNNIEYNSDNCFDCFKSWISTLYVSVISIESYENNYSAVINVFRASSTLTSQDFKRHSNCIKDLSTTLLEVIDKINTLTVMKGVLK